ncbi:uncharacterized protein At4g22758 [Actinidia eriantha]|uniref:uncharacterized protein At4g22758 n=1 Tax=Actinidia eriantha TaxID=165200 RepID=UPI0025869002|nr:uncharacterized protein At4g22758 [Actinidia eriantha]
MPNPKSTHRRGQEERNRRGRLGEKAASFHGRSPAAIGEKLTRPMTVPDLLACRSASAGGGGSPAEGCRKLTKLLLNVTVQRSLGAVQVVMSPESTVGDLIAAALRQYAKEGRRPILESADPSGFDLHYSQFSLESLDREQQLMALGSRNFFLYPKKPAPADESGGGGGGGGVTTPTTSCSKQAEKAPKIGLPWLKFLF